MQITIPDFSLVVLIGASGCGKSTFAAKHFAPTEIISSDRCRGLVDDDENSQAATGDAFALVHFMAETRLKRRRLTVIDATNVRAEDRAHFVAIAKKYHAFAIAIVLNPGEDVCRERNALRPDRQFGNHVVRNHHQALKRGINKLERDGFRFVHELRSVEAIEAVEVIRKPTWTDRRSETGPFDIIGDVHGCADELELLLTELGYEFKWTGTGAKRRPATTAPEGRRAVFVGDLVDRGPRTPDVLRIVMAMVEAGQALCVPGNHDAKFLRWMNGRNVKLTHGLAESVAQMETEPAEFHKQVKKFIDGLVSHIWLDGGALAVAHAGIREEMIGRASGRVREFCLYGETTGETDEFGLPVRYNWAAEYRGETTVVYGHTPVPEAEWLNNTICLDTGCCFGGKLTALRWPEREIVSVAAAKVYSPPIRPLGSGIAQPGMTAQQAADDLLDVESLLGKTLVRCRLGRTVAINPGHAAAALEVMTRFAVSPKWLVYLPPTMSPPATSALEGLLEHPDEAFDYFAGEGVAEVVCQEKHMGSRAVIVVCRDAAAARPRFGVLGDETGVITTRTGRAFFGDAEIGGVRAGDAILEKIRTAMDLADFWERFNTDWAVLDAEIMPWSAKAIGLIQNQYAATGAAARLGLSSVVPLMQQASAEGRELGDLLERFEARAAKADAYVAAYRRYCWPVERIDDYKVAPFHLLATEGAVHMERDHLWHMAELARIAEAGDGVLMATPFRTVTLADPDSRFEAVAWWQEMTEKGGEGMVVKPREFFVRGQRGIVQPAVKVRGLEYLRIIYGPEYDVPANLERLRRRGLAHKRSMAIREFLLGHEALHRFVEGAPLRAVHECVFGVLAMESEPVDPRL